MKMPYMDSWDNTPIVISLTDGYTDNGAPNAAATFTGKCNYSERSKTVRNSDGEFVQLVATLTVKGDIFPDYSTITGSVTVKGKIWKIVTSERPHNPDGTVHHTGLGLM